MKRSDWLERLWETIEAHSALPFRWAGRGDAHDCCTFAADCIDAMTGSNRLDQMLGNYTDEVTALAYIEANGGFAATVSLYLGEPKRLSYMNRGDVAIVLEHGVEIVGVCAGRNVLTAALRGGLMSHDRRRAIAAWGV